jgi:hypothetical protein
MVFKASSKKRQLRHHDLGMVFYMLTYLLVIHDLVSFFITTL